MESKKNSRVPTNYDSWEIIKLNNSTKRPHDYSLHLLNVFHILGHMPNALQALSNATSRRYRLCVSVLS